jgi:hypothetical protein
MQWHARCRAIFSLVSVVCITTVVRVSTPRTNNAAPSTINPDIASYQAQNTNQRCLSPLAGKPYWQAHPTFALAVPELLSRPLRENPPLAAFVEESQTLSKLTRFSAKAPEVLEKGYADFVFKLHSYQQSWKLTGKRQCAGPRDQLSAFPRHTLRKCQIQEPNSLHHNYPPFHRRPEDSK